MFSRIPKKECRERPTRPPRPLQTACPIFVGRLILSDKKLMRICNATLQSDLREIDLSKNPISSFSGLPSSKSLVALDLSSTQISSLLGLTFLPQLQ
jgi:hypothetical protein